LSAPPWAVASFSRTLAHEVLRGASRAPRALRGQSDDVANDFLERLPLLDLRRHRRRPIEQLLLQGGLERRRPPVAHDGQRVVAGDVVEPCARVLDGGAPDQRPEGCEEGLLHDVLTRPAVTHVLLHEGEQAGRVAVIELRERGFLAAAGATRQRTIVLALDRPARRDGGDGHVPADRIPIAPPVATTAARSSRRSPLRAGRGSGPPAPVGNRGRRV
jgi:hypothetical protein